MTRHGVGVLPATANPIRRDDTKGSHRATSCVMTKGPDRAI